MKTQIQPKRQVAEILADFQSYVFSHPAAKDTFQDIAAALGATSSPQIIIFTGPTGVGKSTLVKAASNRLLQHYEDRMIAEPDFVPVVTINAVPPNGNAFNWKDFYIRLLSGQCEPLVDRKLVIPRQASLFLDHPLEATFMQRSTADALRRSMEEYLRLRKTKLLIIDEAQHMLLVGNKQRLECQFESLKSLTIETGITILLVGTYKLLDILDQSGQLTRRSQVVNFPRYDMRRSNDRDNFRKVLGFLEQKLSVHVTTRLDVQADYFYQKSAGCVGILKDWLGRCLEYALQEKVSVIDAAFAERFALKNRGLLTIIEEACLGEIKLTDVGDERLLDVLANGVLLARDDNELARKRPRPGKRYPKRDPVGVSA
jgi:energy-coupling factor transporter ATP-binding protein EcfA2